MTNRTELTPAEEFDLRCEEISGRAVEKYGAVALLPGGHPEYDVFDYCINELAGLPRYIEMMINRLDDLGIADKSASGMLEVMRGEAVLWAHATIRLRQNLIDDGFELGSVERG